MIVAMSWAWQACCRRAGGGEFGQAHAMSVAGRDLLGRGVIMAGQRRAIARGRRHRRRLMFRAQPVLQPAQEGDVVAESPHAGRPFLPQT